MAKVGLQLTGFEFTVLSVEQNRIVLSDENGQLYEINAVPDGTGEAFLEYYRMKAERLEVG